MSDIVDWDPDQLVRAADQELRAGAWREAVELLRRALILDEEHAHAHAMLALALLIPERLAGAAAEARRALQLAGGSPYCHYAMAAAAFANGELDTAWTSCQVALGGGVASQPGTRDTETDAEVHVLGATIRRARGELEPARALLARARSLAPYRASIHVESARLELAAGRLDVAAGHADEALRRSGTDVAANVVAGEVALATGDLDTTDRHARFALLQDSTDRGALRLWAAVKARRRPAIGWAWRALVWVATRSDQQQIGLLVGSFLFVQLLMILANAAGLPGVQGRLVWVWLGFLIGMFWGPIGVHKLVSAELGTPDRSV